MATWRLIIDGPGSGAWNMAADRALLDSHAASDGLPTLRLYRWVRPTVSLGRFQRVEDVDVGFCTANGIDVCRRPTGGRGVLHDEEITYSIVAGVRDGLPRGVNASYRHLCGALVEAYRELGVDAQLTARPRGERGSGACYLHATGADLSLGAAKLSGSAQVWLRDSCLQHGSFVISRDVALEAGVFRLGEPGKLALERSTATLEGALGHRPDKPTVVTAIIAGLGRGLQAEFTTADLTSDEQERARADSGTYAVSG